MTYYAHVREDPATGEAIYQTNQTHLENVARRCEAFAAAFHAQEEGRLAGLAHDIGKNTAGFQHRLLDHGPRVDHATAGAIACAKMDQLWTAMCVMGHHSGQADMGNLQTDPPGAPTFSGRLKKGIQQKYLEACGDYGVLPSVPVPDVRGKSTLSLSFRTRMLYSCLVDADYLDTEEFMQGGSQRGGYDDLPTLLKRLERHIAPWQNPKTELNRLRCQMLQTCMDAGDKPRGLYTLTVPTGGGKTIASMAFALRHAVRHGMERIIYVIPYTSIIEQNAGVFRDILGEQNVLEHHSGVQLDLSDGAAPQEIRRALAAENWDMPVVVTTAVQFFESMYASRSSRCRKLHHLANSVIIFDEAQMLPIPHLRPCTAAIAQLAAQFRSTVVLCTATQPALDDLLQTYAPGLPVTELCPQSQEVYDRFRRVTFRREGVLEDTALARQLSAHRQVLCIVNSRKAAQDIFRLLPEEGSFHLSTLMIPAQRQALLEEIRQRLEDGAPCRVVSTSLIEAGVDVDFPAVYRQLAGVDSILQAAGRCNREGRRSAQESIVTIFERSEPSPPLFRQAIDAARNAMGDGCDLYDSHIVARYFQILRSLKGDALDCQGIVTALERGVDGRMLPFRTVSERFRLLDENTRTVYVPIGEGAALVQQLREGACSRSLFRQLGRYAVSVYEPHYQALRQAGVLETAREVPSLDEDSAILTDLNQYSLLTGLCLSPETGLASFI